ncbi:hypothetical protein [Blastomonas sp.]|uniref:hypothetical protein n=1 Tax=Blastomonas sp. TaxID=1909299 RepID=UPI0026075FFF|nr:hypothetical protein [Blastomonas sp.]MDM7955462.1 hypothetical protein [Blastomonas sp.]
MRLKRNILATSLAAAALTLGACEKKAADGAGVAQGRAPEGTISDELPNLDMLPNDAPLADPADLPPVPGVSGPAAPAAPEASDDAPQAAPAPAPAEPALEGSIAE